MTATNHNWVDADGNPAGGTSFGPGFTISWQNGPLGRHGSGARMQPNGAFFNDIVDAMLERLDFFQKTSDGRFACAENEGMIEHLKRFKELEDARTQRRINEGTEGTHEGN